MDSGSESPPLRSTILGSLLRGRPRNSSQSHANHPPLNTPAANGDSQHPNRELSPSPHPPSPSTGSLAAVAALTGGTGTFITNTNLLAGAGASLSGRRLSRHAGASNNPGSTPTGISTSNSAPSAPTSPVNNPLANMLRRKPNPNPNPNLNASHQQQQAQSSTNITASHTAPNMFAPTSSPSHAITAITSQTTGVPHAHTHTHLPASHSHPPLFPSATPATNQSFRIRLVPHLDSRRSLRFDAISRDLHDGDPALRIGRFTDRSGMGLAAVNALGSNKLAFKSKVVSRAHAEIWVEKGGKFFIKDTKSSSGTFLNHIRLSPANQESRPFQLKDGDILQLGVDYQGGAEDIYKSVKIRVEVGREWQAGANAFNTNALKNLKTLAAVVGTTVAPNGKPSTAKTKVQIPDCCICLFSVTIRQALFIAPCSHTFHFKCIRPLIEAHHPAFSCPLCRTFADLEEDVEIESPEVDDADLDDQQPEGEGGGESGVDADGEAERRTSGESGITNARVHANVNVNASGDVQIQRGDMDVNDDVGSGGAGSGSSSGAVANATVNARVVTLAGPVEGGGGGSLFPISEHERDRDAAGGETEVEPDSGPHLSILTSRSGARRERNRHHAGGQGTGPGPVQEGRACEGYEEVEMADLDGYDASELLHDVVMEEDEDEDEEEEGEGMVSVIQVDTAGEFGVATAAATTVGGSHGGSIGGKRKR
ncbi:hypothetical protein AX17_004874 [Amanita inopinata Kibby_2008]|nr:hypothetical protein AX17_004874 [Amanita inopinata Kibby_2008]